MTAGWVLGRLHLKRWVEPFVFETTLGGQVIAWSGSLFFYDTVKIALLLSGIIFVVTSAVTT